MFYWLVSYLLWVLFKIFFSLEVEGLKNIPQKGAVLIVSNHLSYLDPPLFGASIKRRKLNFIARKSLFKFPLFAVLIRCLGAFPMKRDGPDQRAFRRIFEILKREGTLLLFPEGTRSKDGKLQKGKPGVGMIALKSRAKVIPALIVGSNDALPIDAKMVRFRKIKVRFGKSLSLGKFYNQKRGKEIYEQVSEEIMRGIKELQREKDENGCH